MQGFPTEEALEEYLSRPYDADIAAVQSLDGDFVLLGAGGKMGPTLAMRIRRALNEAGQARRVFAVSRFSDAAAAERLRASGVEVISADLLADSSALPNAENVIYLVGRKFGSTGQAGLTWMMNVVAADRAATRYQGQRITVLSSGNIYPLRPVAEGGATESTEVGPVGEYAQTVLGRERIFEHHSATTGTPTIALRLNYAVEPRYGVLLDLAQKIWREEPVDVTMGFVNVIWQGDANSIVLRSLLHTSAAAPKLNLTGLEIRSVRSLAQAFAARFGKPAHIAGVESPTALLNDATACAQLFGPPPTPLEAMLDWTADWIRREQRTLGKPTHFETRDGKF
jgi:nucleoside-diphosphate-sugar epimerase